MHKFAVENDRRIETVTRRRQKGCSCVAIQMVVANLSWCVWSHCCLQQQSTAASTSPRTHLNDGMERYSHRRLITGGLVTGPDPLKWGVECNNAWKMRLVARTDGLAREIRLCCRVKVWQSKITVVSRRSLQMPYYCTIHTHIFAALETCQRKGLQRAMNGNTTQS